jgi:GNAT superfamily N-acetyltransferase
VIAQIGILNPEQIETLVDWAAAEGWNPGLNDASRFRKVDPRGFLGAFVGGRMVAGISVVAYDDHFGFLGLYICHPDFRGQGIGRAVWDAGMAYLGDRTIGLDGVPAQQGNYRSMGFATQYETIRMSGLLDLAPARHCRVAPLSTADRVLDIDRSCFPADRQAFRDAWITSPQAAWVATQNGDVTGYMVARACRMGHKIGPLFAKDINTAVDLLGAFHGQVQIDVPMYQVSLLSELEGRGFVRQFKTARMYRGTPRHISSERVFAVTSLELG